MNQTQFNETKKSLLAALQRASAGDDHKGTAKIIDCLEKLTRYAVLLGLNLSE